MKIIIGFLLILFLAVHSNLNAQDVTTVEAMDSDISDNLDLEAVASIFGDSKDLEDFEKKLNDPETRISNLDLNNDGEVDYLRVIETSKGETHLVTIQAVIGKDKYQDVAVIDVEKDSKDKTQVQVVGDVYMYGPDYIITPVYIYPPVIIVWFWGPYYSPWRSPFYWGYYPPYYRPWRPYPTPIYRTNVRVNINVNNSYNRNTIRKSNNAVKLQEKSRRNDFFAKNPDKTYAKRKQAIDNRKGTEKVDILKTDDAKERTHKKVQDDWKPEKDRIKPDDKPVRKDLKPAGKPAQRPDYKPRQRPDYKPAQRPAAR